MSGPKPTVESVHSTLLAAFNGFQLRDGSYMSAGDDFDDIERVPTGQLPFLLFEVGQIVLRPWQNFTQWIAWDVPATLKVIGEAGPTMKRRLLATCHDLVSRTKQVLGLPVDDSGALVPFSDKTMALYDRDQLTFLADRGAPYITNFVPGKVDGAFGYARVMFHLETTIDYDPRQLSTAQYFEMGINPQLPGQLFDDPTLLGRTGVAVTPNENVLAYGPYTTSDPRVLPLGGRFTPSVPGTEPRETLMAVNVTPYAPTLSAGTPTVQLSAIATWGNYRSAYVQGQAQWTSTNPSIATVSSAGICSRVAAGTTAVKATFNGVVSNTITVTCT